MAQTNSSFRKPPKPSVSEMPKQMHLFESDSAGDIMCGCDPSMYHKIKLPSLYSEGMLHVCIGCFILIITSSLVIHEKFYESLIDTVSKVIKVSSVHVCACVCMCVRVYAYVCGVYLNMCLSIGPCVSMLCLICAVFILAMLREMRKFKRVK